MDEKQPKENSELDNSSIMSEWILRIVSLEKLLISKGLISEKELEEMNLQCFSQFLQELKSSTVKTEEN